MRFSKFMQNKQEVFLGAASIVFTLAGIALLSTSYSIATDMSSVQSKPVVVMPIVAKLESKPAGAVTESVTEPEVTEDDWMTEGVALRIGDAAGFYAENMRYPKYSKPLEANDWVALNPRAFVARDMPIEIQEGLSAAIVLPQYVASRDKDLPVQVRINGLSKGSGVSSISVYMKEDTEREHEISLSVDSSTDETITYSGTYPSAGFPANVSNESYIYADVVFWGSMPVTLSAVYLLEDNAATLSSLGNAYVEGAHLMIPASFDVELPGSYRFQANLLDQASKQPISHLNATFLLSKNAADTVLKVHAETLRLKGSAGPYVLTDINLTRSPGRPGDRTSYGSAAQDSYKVGGFDLSSYSEEKYVNPQNEQRLAFLQKMAGQ